MWKFLVGLLVGMALWVGTADALRFARPPTFSEWNSNTFSQLNDVLLQIWNTLNGRVSMDVVTVDPDGSRPCSVGEFVLFDTGTDQLCVCVTTATKVWRCVNLS